MFSGLVWVGILAAFGSSTLTTLVITGMVIRKMISNTSITSTRGVVLIVEMTSSSPPPPTFIPMFYGPCVVPGRSLLAGRASGHARVHAPSADHVGVQVAGEVLHTGANGLVAAQQPVVSEHRGHRDRQTDGGHDQRLADRAGYLVDAGLARHADRQQ